MAGWGQRGHLWLRRRVFEASSQLLGSLLDAGDMEGELVIGAQHLALLQGSASWEISPTLQKRVMLASVTHKTQSSVLEFHSTPV